MADHIGKATPAHVPETSVCPLLRCVRAPCPGADDLAIERRTLGLSPLQLAAALPSLGKLLYLSVNQRASPSGVLPPGLLTDTVELMPLLQFRKLRAASLITVEGPCEWIECADRYGHASARMYLLPDSDFLAWDGLHAAVGSNAPVARASPTAQPCLDRARIVQFRHRTWAGMQLLSAESCVRISTLSCRVATQIVRSDVVSGWLRQRP
ncbi:MAG: hypothetical protein ABI178_07135 [Rhodanobacter sp.]